MKFANAMEAKLARNRHKGDRDGWLRCEAEWLFDRLIREVQELNQAITSGVPLDVLNEAADVANFAMMIADKVLTEASPGRPNPERSGGGQ